MAVFYNQATLSYSGGTTNSNVTTGELLETISVTKTAVSGTYTPGGRAAFVVSIVNSGENPVSGLTLTDDLGAFELEGQTIYPLAYRPDSLLYFIGGVPETAPAVTAGPPLEISGIDIPAGSNVTLIYETDLTPSAPQGANAEITNTASVDGSCLADPVTDTASISMAGEARLSISKSVSPETITGCEPLTYTFVIQNAGSADAEAADSVVVSDLFDPILSDLTVTLNGTALSAPADYTYDETTGQFATVSGKITVPAATFTQKSGGVYTSTPGVTVLTVTGTV